MSIYLHNYSSDGSGAIDLEKGQLLLNFLSKDRSRLNEPKFISRTSSPLIGFVETADLK